MPFPPDAFAPYNAALKAWIQATGAKAAAVDDGSAVGAMHLGTRLHGVTLLPRGGIAVESRPDCGTTVRLLGAFRLGAPHVPVILASGSAREAVEKMFRAHPYDVFLPKPYTLAELKGAFLAAATAQDPVAAQDP